MLVRKLKKRPTITCPVCGAAMKIILTRIPNPPPRQAACLASAKTEESLCNAEPTLPVHKNSGFPGYGYLRAKNGIFCL